LPLAGIGWGGHSGGMDHLSHFRREVRAFEAACRAADSGLVPSCPGWGVPDLVMHLGGVHRYLVWIIGDRLTEQPDPADLSFLGLPADPVGWPDPAGAPATGPLPAGLLDWFAEGAAKLEAVFAATDPGVPVWTWSGERSVGFWLRMQTIEAAIHRWDAEMVAGTASDLMLFLWHRVPYERLDVHGDRTVLDRYFTLVPPV
jgi:uncharacterized protein (TIGR03083 family)